MLLFYMVYWAFLRKETYYTSNRFFLLFGLFSSTLMPLMPIHYNVMTEGVARNGNLFTEVSSAFKGIQPYTGSGFEVSYSLSWLDALLIIYFTGAGIFMLRLLVQTGILCIQIIKNKTILLDGLRVVETEKYGLPFSFFNVVYINPKFHKQDVLPEILAHEKVHIREKHWVDLLIIELLTVIFWFNLVIWFFEHAIKLNHEYLADHGVISKGSHVGKYQALLVNQLMGMQIIGITNNLNFGINTNRLKMMTKQKTPKIKAIKLVWAMPIIAILLFAFAEPNYKVIPEKQDPGKSAVQNVIEKRVTMFTGTVVDENAIGFPGVQVLIVGSTIGITTDKEGSFTLGLINEVKVEFSYVGKETLQFTGNELLSMKEKRIVMKDIAIVLDFNQKTEEVVPPPQPVKTEGIVEEIIVPPPPLRAFDENAEEHIFTIVEQDPEYPGGHNALRKYVTDMQTKLANDEKIKGKAKVGFTVDAEGKATNIKTIEQDNDLAGKGAATIVMGMETWTPGKQRNKAVSVNFILPVEFK
jgi:hypothetical protein